MLKSQRVSSLHFHFLSILIGFLLLSFIGSAQNAAFLQQKYDAKLNMYESGVIHIKVTEGIGPFTKQSQGVAFEIRSLDDLVEQFEVSSLEKRFKHKPIAENLGLPDLSRIYRISFPTSKNVHELARVFSSDPNIEYAEAIPIHAVTEMPDDPLYASLQHLPQIMAEEAWDIHKGEDGSEEIIIAIVDTGVDWDHEDLQSNIWENMAEDADGDGQTMEYIFGEWVLDPDDLNGIDDDGNGFVDDLIGWNFINDNSDVRPILTNPVADHGTHCAGISASSTNNGTGIASISWNVSLMGICTDENNSLPYGYDGIIYAAENGADVISNSWSTASYSLVDQEVIDYANGLGSIVLAAAGNHNSTQMMYPASYLGAISVASVSENDTKAGYSAYGFAVDISAPGGGSEGGILSTVLNDGYANKSGTSMATPLVAGLLGLLKSYNPEWSNDELLTQVLGTADDISDENTNYPNFLGSGRINAYHTLLDENVLPPQELKLDIINYSLEDGNGNGMLEPGDEVIISSEFRNFSHMTGSSDVTFTLTTFDPDVTITTSTFTVDVPADSEFEIDDAFVFEVNEGAEMHVASFFIEVSADIPVIVGQDFQLDFVIAPDGLFVWDGELNKTGYSGAFITQFLEEQGYDVLYTDVYPNSFNGFDAVFLSFSNGGEQANESVLLDYRHTEPIQEYLIGGGNLYMEGMALMSIPEYAGFPNAAVLKNLFGVESSSFAFSANPISSLEGQAETMGDGITFTASNQANNWYIDQITPTSSANIPYVEIGYGNVSVANDGNLGQKTFFLGYSLSELVDVDPVSSRYNMLLRTMDFFGYPQPDDFVVANFATDQMEVVPGTEIQFNDLSISDEGSSVVSWAWDFDEDGEIDATDQDPSWTYDAGGNYDITLIVSNGEKTDTLVRQNHILVRSGIFVYEGTEGGLDQSGTFIRDFMLDQGYEVVYSNSFPDTLDGFDAAFISMGSSYFESPKLNDDMATTLKDYLVEGGRAYLEGANAFGRDQDGNNLLWYTFGIEDVSDGDLNEISVLAGQNESIMSGIQFMASDQFDVRSIDVFEPTVSPDGIPAFVEGYYGIVGIQFDGSTTFGQRTFCLSYSLANLEDGEFPNTRGEVLQRIIDFLFTTTGVSPDQSFSNVQISAFPNPADNYLIIELDLGKKYEQAITIDLYDLWGKQVMSQGIHSSTTTINVGSLSGGTYFYSVTGEKIRETGKVIIAR